MAARMAAGCITVIIPGQTTTPPSRTVASRERPMTGALPCRSCGARGRAAVPQAGPRRNELAYGRPAGGPVEDPDLDLVRRAVPATGPLVRRSSTGIWRGSPRWPGGMLGNRADAEDVAQEVFLRVWQQAAKWRGGRGAVLDVAPPRHAQSLP